MHDAIHVAKALGISVSVVPRMFEVVGSSVAFDRLGGLTMLGVRRFGLSPRARFAKRTLDVAGVGDAAGPSLPGARRHRDPRAR